MWHGKMFISMVAPNLAGILMLKVNIRSSRLTCSTYSKYEHYNDTSRPWNHLAY